MMPSCYSCPKYHINQYVSNHQTNCKQKQDEHCNQNVFAIEKAIHHAVFHVFTHNAALCGWWWWSMVNRIGMASAWSQGLYDAEFQPQG